MLFALFCFFWDAVPSPVYAKTPHCIETDESKLTSPNPSA